MNDWLFSLTKIFLILGIIGVMLMFMISKIIPKRESMFISISIATIMSLVLELIYSILLIISIVMSNEDYSNISKINVQNSTSSLQNKNDTQEGAIGGSSSLDNINNNTLDNPNLSSVNNNAKPKKVNSKLDSNIDNSRSSDNSVVSSSINSKKESINNSKNNSTSNANTKQDTNRELTEPEARAIAKAKLDGWADVVVNDDFPVDVVEENGVKYYSYYCNEINRARAFTVFVNMKTGEISNDAIGIGEKWE